MTTDEEAKILNLNEVLREIHPLLLADAINSNTELELELQKNKVLAWV